MRIAVFIKKTTFHSGFGGMETQNKVLCEGLVRLGHTIDVFSPSWELNKETESENGVVYHFIPSNYRYLFSSLNKNSWPNKSYEVFKQSHTQQPFDLVVSQSSAGIGIIKHKNRLSVKVVSIAHGSAMGEFQTYLINAKGLKDFLRVPVRLQYALRQFFYRQRTFILNSNKVIAVSTAVKKQLENETYASDDHIVVINNGIIPSNLSVKQDNTPTFVYVGQLVRDKGVELFIEMAKDPRFSGLSLEIIGGGPMSDALLKVSQSLSQGLNIRMLGKLPYDKTIARLSACQGSVFLFPTRRLEGFPMVIVEAMFAGLPVVSYEMGGVGDAIQQDKTGVLIPFEDKENFISKALDLATHKDTVLHMGTASRKYATEHFTLDIMLNKYEKLFEEILKP